jgi:hypothetical protein
MEDKERIEEEAPEEDVEGHRGKSKLTARQSEEQADDAEGEEDDVEGHAFKPPTSL